MKIKNYLFYHIETFLGNIKGTLKLNFATYFATLGQYETFGKKGFLFLFGIIFLFFLIANFFAHLAKKFAKSLIIRIKENTLKKHFSVPLNATFTFIKKNFLISRFKKL